MLAEAALDRNIWQYLVDAHAGRYDPGSDPNSELGAERLAMYRLALWDVKLWLLPAVVKEAERIPDPELRRANEGMRTVFLLDFVDQLDEPTATARAGQLLTSHPDPDDCRLVAEAEVAGVAPCLLTFDGRLVRRLGPVAHVRLLQPSALWTEVAIPRGTPPRSTPHPSNPLSRVTVVAVVIGSLT